MATRERVRRGLILVPEGRQIFGGLTIEENLRLGARMRDLSETEIRRMLGEVCEPFPVLLQRMREPCANLSGGAATDARHRARPDGQSETAHS